MLQQTFAVNQFGYFVQENIFARVPNIRGEEKIDMTSARVCSREALFGCTLTLADHWLLQKYTSQCLGMTKVLVILVLILCMCISELRNSLWRWLHFWVYFSADRNSYLKSVQNVKGTLEQKEEEWTRLSASQPRQEKWVNDDFISHKLNDVSLPEK